MSGEIVQEPARRIRLRQAAAKCDGPLIKSVVAPAVKEAFAETAAGGKTLFDISAVVMEPGTGAHVLSLDGQTLQIMRAVTPERRDDLIDVQTDPAGFLARLKEEVTRYAESIPAQTRAVTQPHLFMRSEAYVLRWYLWGYFTAEPA